jgi:hypothetical protein
LTICASARSAIATSATKTRKRSMTTHRNRLRAIAGS